MRIMVEFVLLSVLQGCVQTLTRQELEERYTDGNQYNIQRGSLQRQILVRGQQRTNAGRKVLVNMPRSSPRYLSNSNNVQTNSRNRARNVLLGRSRTRISPLQNIRVVQNDGTRRNIIARGNTYIRQTSNGRVRYANQSVTRRRRPYNGQTFTTRRLTNQFVRGQQPQIRRVVQNNLSRSKLRISNVSGKPRRIGNIIGSKIVPGRGTKIMPVRSRNDNKTGLDKFVSTREETALQKNTSPKKHIVVKLPNIFNKKADDLVIPSTGVTSNTDGGKMNAGVGDISSNMTLLDLNVARSDPKPESNVVNDFPNLAKSDKQSVTSDSKIGMSTKTVPKRKAADSQQRSPGTPLQELEATDSFIGQNGGSHHWSYKGEAGPSNWSMLYPTCSGTRQSPVDLRDRNIIYQDLPPFHFNGFHGQGGSFTLTNNGHTASIAVVGNLTVEGGGLDGMYKTAELHFHWGSSNNFGSEHSINGRKYPLEMHIVNYAVKYGNLTNAMKYRDGLAVLGTFFDVTEENPYFRSIEMGLQSAKYAGNYTRLHPVNLYGLLPRDTTRYYRYYGSLTTPPCFQSVMWTLFEDIQHLSPYQMRLLRQLYESHHESHGGGHHQGGHGLNGHMKAQFPVEQFLMDNFRPIQPHFDRVINCNIPRYADPNFIQRSRHQSRTPQHLDFITQRISQVNADALLNKTLSKWLLSKGLPSDMLTQEQLAQQSRGIFDSQGNSHFDHNAVPNHQSSSFNTGRVEGAHGGHRRPFVGQGSGHNMMNQPQQLHNPPPPSPPLPPNPSQLDLQVIQTQKIGPDGQMVSEIQVQVDAASGVSQEQLQVLLEDPSLMDQIQQIIQQQGGVNQTHEIIVSRPPQLHQPMGSSGSQQQFGGQLPQHQQQQPAGRTHQQGSTVKPSLPKQHHKSKFTVVSANISDIDQKNSHKVILKFDDSVSKPVENERTFVNGHAAHLASDLSVQERFEQNVQPNVPSQKSFSEHEYNARPNHHHNLQPRDPLQHTILPEHHAPMSAQHLDTLQFRSNVIPDFLAHSAGAFQPKRKTVPAKELVLSSGKRIKSPFLNGFGNKDNKRGNVLLNPALSNIMSLENHRRRRAIIPGPNTLTPKKGFINIESVINELNKNVDSVHKPTLVGRDILESNLLNGNVDTPAIKTKKKHSNVNHSKTMETSKGNVQQHTAPDSQTTPTFTTIANALYHTTVPTPIAKSISLEQTAHTNSASATKTNVQKSEMHAEQSTVSYTGQTVSAPTQGNSQTFTQTNSQTTLNPNINVDQTTSSTVQRNSPFKSITTESQNTRPAPVTSTSSTLVASTTEAKAQQPSTQSLHMVQDSGIQSVPSSGPIVSTVPTIPSISQAKTTSGTTSLSVKEIQSQLSAPLPLNENSLASRQQVPATDVTKLGQTKQKIAIFNESKMTSHDPQVTTLNVLAPSTPGNPKTPSTIDPLNSKVLKPTIDSTGQQPIPATSSTNEISTSGPDLSLTKTKIKTDTGMFNNNKVDVLIGSTGSHVQHLQSMTDVQTPLSAAAAPMKQTSPASTKVSDSVLSLQSALDSPIIPTAPGTNKKPMFDKQDPLSSQNQQTVSSFSVSSNNQKNIANSEQTTVSNMIERIPAPTKDMSKSSQEISQTTLKPNRYTAKSTSYPIQSNTHKSSLLGQQTSSTTDAYKAQSSTFLFPKIDTTIIQNNKGPNSGNTFTGVSTAPTRVKRFTTEAGPPLSNKLNTAVNEVTSKQQSSTTVSNKIYSTDPLILTEPLKSTQARRDNLMPSVNKLKANPPSTSATLTSTTEAVAQQPSTQSIHSVAQGVPSSGPTTSTVPTTTSSSQAKTISGTASVSVNEIQSQLAAPLPHKKFAVASRKPVPKEVSKLDPTRQRPAILSESKMTTHVPQVTTFNVLSSSSAIDRNTPSTTDPLYLQQVQKPTIDSIAAVTTNQISARGVDLSLPKTNIKTDTGNKKMVGTLTGRTGSSIATSLSVPDAQASLSGAAASQNQNVNAIQVADPLQISKTYTQSTKVSNTVPSFQSSLDSPIAPAALGTNTVPVSNKQAPLSEHGRKSNHVSQQTASLPSQTITVNDLLQTSSNHNQQVSTYPDPLQTLSSQNQQSIQAIQYAQDTLMTGAKAHGNPSVTTLGKPAVDTTLPAADLSHSITLSTVKELPLASYPITGRKQTVSSVQTPTASGATVSSGGYVNSLDPTSANTLGHKTPSSTGISQQGHSVTPIEPVVASTVPQPAYTGHAAAVGVVSFDSPAPMTGNQPVSTSISQQNTYTGHAGAVAIVPAERTPSVSSNQPASTSGLGPTYTGTAAAVSIVPLDSQPASLPSQLVSASIHPSGQKPSSTNSAAAVNIEPINRLSSISKVQPAAASNLGQGSVSTSYTAANSLGQSGQPIPNQPIPTNTRIDTPASKSQTVNSAASTASNNAIKLNHPIVIGNIGAPASMASLAGNSLITSIAASGLPSGPSSITHTSLDTAPFDRNGYFDFNMAVNRPDWSLHSLKKTPTENNNQAYSEPPSITDGSFDMGFLDPSSTTLSNTFESFPNSHEKNTFDGGHLGYNALSQPSPGQTVLSDNFAIDGSSSISSPGINNPISSQFSSIEEANRYIQRLNQGTSSHESSPFSGNVDLTTTNPGPSEFASYEAAQKHIQTIDQASNGGDIIPGVQDQLGQNAAFDSVGNPDLYSSPQFPSLDAHRLLEGIGPLDHPKPPPSGEFSSIQDAQNYIKTLERPSTKEQTFGSFRSNQLSPQLLPGQDQRGFAENSLPSTTQYNGIEILPEQIPLSYPIDTKVGRAFSDQPQGAVLPIDQEFKNPSSLPLVPEQRNPSFSNQRQMPFRQTHPAQNYQSYQKNTAQSTNSNGLQPRSFNSDLTQNRVEPLDMSYRIPSQFNQVANDHGSHRIPTSSNIESLDSAYRYQGNDIPSPQRRSANSPQGRSQSTRYMPTGSLNSQHQRPQLPLQNERPNINEPQQFRPHYNTPAHSARNGQFNQRRNGESVQATNAINIVPQHQRPVNRGGPWRQQRVNSKQQPSNQVPQHQMRPSMERGRGSVNQRPIAVQAVNNVNHVPGYQRRLQSPLPATRGRSASLPQSHGDISAQQRRSRPIRQQNNKKPRPLQITVHINQDNKIMRNEVNNHGPGDSRRRSSHHRSQSRNHVTVDADGQMTRRQLPTIARTQPLSTRSPPAVAYPNRANRQTQFDPRIQRTGNPSPYQINRARRPFENRQRQTFPNYRQNARYPSSNYHNGF